MSRSLAPQNRLRPPPEQTLDFLPARQVRHEMAPSRSAMVGGGHVPGAGSPRSDSKSPVVPVTNFQVGDLLRIRPGDKVPVDYRAVEGSSSVVESMITGEHMPVSRRIGDMVIGSTLNTSGTLVMRFERVGFEAILAQIVQMIVQAQHQMVAMP